MFQFIRRLFGASNSSVASEDQNQLLSEYDSDVERGVESVNDFLEQHVVQESYPPPVVPRCIAIELPCSNNDPGYSSISNRFNRFLLLNETAILVLAICGAIYAIVVTVFSIYWFIKYVI